MSILTKIQRQAALVNIIGRLIIMSHDDGKEFDSLCKRIMRRIDFYEKNKSE